MKIVKSGPFRVRLSAEKEKKLPTGIDGLFSLREKAPTKNACGRFSYEFDRHLKVAPTRSLTSVHLKA